jgi:hypothetical protein
MVLSVHGVGRDRFNVNLSNLEQEINFALALLYTI